MVEFIGGLKTNGKYKGFDGKLRGEIRDLEGRPVSGKRLSEFTFFTESERFDMEYVKRESEKERLCREYGKKARDKILDRIFIQLQTGGCFREESFLDFPSFIVRYLDEDFGVTLSRAQVERFMNLLQNLNNRSHLWLNCGWTPEELYQQSGRRLPKTVSVGPNLKRMFESGELDRAEYEKMLTQFGIKLLN